jgi:hypothetical protein
MGMYFPLLALTVIVFLAISTFIFLQLLNVIIIAVQLLLHDTRTMCLSTIQDFYDAHAAYPDASEIKKCIKKTYRVSLTQSCLMYRLQLLIEEGVVEEFMQTFFCEDDAECPGHMKTCYKLKGSPESRKKKKGFSLKDLFSDPLPAHRSIKKASQSGKLFSFFFFIVLDHLQVLKYQRSRVKQLDELVAHVLLAHLLLLLLEHRS